MDELVRKLVALRDDLVPFWNETRCAQTFRALRRLRRRRKLLRAIGSCGVAAAVCCVILLPHAWLDAPGPGSVTATVTAAASEDWLSLTRRGEHARAYELLARGVPVANDATALLAAADAARLSDHAEASVAYFRAILRDHPAHPETAAAAFALGRVLLEQLGRPVEAAEAFANAAELTRDPLLEQDAAAREVECWSKAGRAAEAYQRALLFQALYPKSHRLRTVQLFGGLPQH